MKDDPKNGAESKDKAKANRWKTCFTSDVSQLYCRITVSTLALRMRLTLLQFCLKNLSSKLSKLESSRMPVDYVNMNSIDI